MKASTQSNIVIKSWSTISIPGIEISGLSMTEPNQNCPSIAQILQQFGAAPDVPDVGVFDDPDMALNNQYNPLMDIDDVNDAQGYLDERERAFEAQRTNSPSQRSDASQSRSDVTTKVAQRIEEETSKGAGLPTSGTGKELQRCAPVTLLMLID